MGTFTSRREKMKTTILLFAFLIALGAALTAQEVPSPYVGQQHRSIKALSAGEIEGYLLGNGMGFAKVAELNHYPGPKRVLDLAGELGLTEQQRTQTEYVYKKMHYEAVFHGERLVEKERRLDEMFSQQNAREKGASILIEEIAGHLGRIRAAHVTAHIAMRSILSPEQIAAYDRLRGYSTDTRH